MQWSVILHVLGTAVHTVLVPFLLITFLPSLITGLMNAPSDDAHIFGKALQILVRIFSVVTHRDEPNSLKAPLLSDVIDLVKMIMAKRAAAKGVLKVMLPLVFLPLLFGSPGCASAQVKPPTTAQWKAAGIDSSICVGTSLLSAASDAMAEALQSVLQPMTTDQWKAYGLGLAKKYGPNAAVCAAGKLYADLGGAQLLTLLMAKMPAGSSGMLAPREGFGWLATHQAEWATPAGG